MCAAVKTLKASADFRRLARQGKKWAGPAFIMQISRQGQGDFRLGLTASRRVGNAVVRNRAKRRLREAVRLLIRDGRAPAGRDLVLIARTAAATRDFAALRADIDRGLRSLCADRDGADRGGKA